MTDGGQRDDEPFEETGGWNTEDQEEVVVGKRRMRPRGGTLGRPRFWLIAIAAALVLAGGAYGAYRWFTRPTGLAAAPNPAVVAPGGFRSSIGDDNTITVGLEVRSVADEPLTLVSARIVAPAGLTVVEVTLAPPGDGNVGFALEGPLPAIEEVRLGTEGADRNAVLAARFTVDCQALPAPGAADDPTGEQILVTVRIGEQQREEELTPPVIDEMPWLTATAQRVCRDPLPTTSPEPPLPPLPEPTATASPG